MKKFSDPSSSKTHPVSEFRYLEELMTDFPCDCPWTVTEAFEQLNIRYTELEKQSFYLAKVNFGFSFKSYFSALISYFHQYLFKNILSNAGSFRSEQDKNSGRIGFGGESYRMIGNMQFTGAAPQNIPGDVETACAYLKKKDKNPVDSALRFYQLFVKTHPFYDANGRIARLLVSSYLAYYKHYVNWEDILKKGKQTEFYKKLNECHKRTNGPSFDKYFDLLYNFFRKFVMHWDEFIKMKK